MAEAVANRGSVAFALFHFRPRPPLSAGTPVGRLAPSRAYSTHFRHGEAGAKHKLAVSLPASLAGQVRGRLTSRPARQLNCALYGCRSGVSALPSLEAPETAKRIPKISAKRPRKWVTLRLVSLSRRRSLPIPRRHRGVSRAHQRAADHVHQRYSEDPLWRRARRGETPKGGAPPTRYSPGPAPARRSVPRAAVDCAFLTTPRAHYALPPHWQRISGATEKSRSHAVTTF